MFKPNHRTFTQEELDYIKTVEFQTKFLGKSNEEEFRQYLLKNPTYTEKDIQNVHSHTKDLLGIDINIFKVNHIGFIQVCEDTARIKFGNSSVAFCLFHYWKYLSRNEKGIVMSNKSLKVQNPPLNQILYGPPGTGKTYHTIDKALEILGVETQGKSRAELKAEFDKFRQSGQIEFITFHQSFSYEEFVEGIKPNIDDPKNMFYEPQDGIFKKICESALNNLQDSQKSQTILQNEKIFENKLNEFLGNLMENQIDIEKSNVGSFKISGFDDDKIYIDTQDTTRNVDLKIDILTKILQSNKEFNTATSMWNEFVGNYRDQKSTYYFQLYKAFEEFEKSYKPQNQAVSEVKLKPFILIIDEINRGNISKILGELITLIEPSKRIGADEELRVSLPYSGNEFDGGKGFGVPSNLYIIGTMNTADRSIALLDTALRRRFEFIEMMPEWNNKNISENCEGVNLQNLLKSMNDRIEFLLDREHTIGHSFFIGVNSLDKLREVFKLKIIPLLQEYFYDDYAKIDAVLNGNGMVEITEAKASKLFPKKDNDLELEDKKIHKITLFDSEIWDKLKTYTKIYENEQE